MRAVKKPAVKAAGQVSARVIVRGFSQHDLAGTGDLQLARNTAGDLLDLATGFEEGCGLFFDGLMGFDRR